MTIKLLVYNQLITISCMTSLLDSRINWYKVTECEYEGEKFTYPDWVIAIAEWISVKDFFERFPKHIPMLGDGLYMWCGWLCEIETYFAEFIENYHYPLINHIVSNGSKRSLTRFVLGTKGKTNNKWEYRRGYGPNNTTDSVFRNDMVCLADLMLRYKESNQDNANPDWSVGQKVAQLV